MSFGYSNVEVERTIDQLVAGGFIRQLFSIAYEADTDFLDGRVRYVAHDRLTLGGEFRLYQNDGSFGLDRDDFRGWAEVGFLESYAVTIAYRTVDYDEETFDFDDYDADIIELSIGYAW